MKQKKNFVFFALGACGTGISGGDRIFIELAREFSKKNNVTIFVWKEGEKMIKRQNIVQNMNLNIDTVSLEKWAKYGFLLGYISRIIAGIIIGIKLKLPIESSTIVYSASEFWMDLFPAVILKLRYKKILWIAAWYQTAPNPLKGYTNEKRKNKYFFPALLYWIVQQPVKPLIAFLSDIVLVNNDEERKIFPRLNAQHKALVILGAVRIEEIENWKQEHPHIKKTYDAVFQGRFHPQKGVVELIDIWKLITQKMPRARLVMIGDGPLMNHVREKIKKLSLGNNIFLKGYVFDGDQKYRIFSQSKIVLHPAFYDSGGMAASEAMAFGLCCVGFDLPAYASYYPKGMLKIPKGNISAYANAVVDLLQNKKKRKKLEIQAQEMITSSWSWQNRASLVMEAI